jgi:Polyketide cyclase / dehydrase and lipid transport
VQKKVQGATGRLTDYVEGGGGPGLMAAVTGAKSMAEGKSPTRSMFGAGWAGLKEKVRGMFGKGRGKGGGKQKLKLTNIVESVDVGVPVKLAYNQWTQYEDFPTFTKKVEQARPQDSGQDDGGELKVAWKAQVFWSHREWEATIVDQRPDERIVWRSQGQKGHVDGAVTFHELTPNLTRIVLVMEYHPQGLMERTGNLWRAQGRRTRLELKHFQRHVMAHAMLDPDDIEGWRGTIEDGQIVQDHETALAEEQEQNGEQPADEFEDEDRDRAADDDQEPADEAEVPQDEAEQAEAPEEAYEDEVPDDEAEASDNGSRSNGRRRGAAAGSGARGRRPAAARAGRSGSDDRPQRAVRRGATQGRTR